MNAYKRFHQLLRRDFLPLLRADGFNGSGITFRRLKGDRIDVLNVQGSLYGGQCCVNVAVHFSFLPPAGGGPFINPMKLKECECAFRERLHEPKESDRWWTYGTSDAEAEASVASLVDTYQRRGAVFFRKFEPFPEVFEEITPAQLDSGDFSKLPGQLSIPLSALTMARIMEHLGRHTECREFVLVGLRHVGGAVTLRAELERLRDGGGGSA